MVDRVQEPPAFGLMCDLLWADPVPDYNDTDGARGALLLFSRFVVLSLLLCSTRN
jgi:diadenosine tetraphosphatase ApaH/serine/threonine PP2A family protein phosphatase